LPIALRIIASNTGSAKVTISDIDVSTGDEVVVTSATGFDEVVVTAGVLQAARVIVSKTVIRIL
jgi:formylmethanofuran dehydrogenase subunit D